MKVGALVTKIHTCNPIHSPLFSQIAQVSAAVTFTSQPPHLVPLLKLPVASTLSRASFVNALQSQPVGLALSLTVVLDRRTDGRAA